MEAIVRLCTFLVLLCLILTFVCSGCRSDGDTMGDEKQDHGGAVPKLTDR